MKANCSLWVIATVTAIYEVLGSIKLLNASNFFCYISL